MKFYLNCPRCNANGKRKGRWKVMQINAALILLCPYCQLQARFPRSCTVCGNFNIPLIKENNQPFRSAPELLKFDPYSKEKITQEVEHDHED